MALPSPKDLRKKKDAKIKKYMKIADTLAGMIIKQLPSNSEVEFDDLQMAGVEEIVNQMNRIYSSKTLIAKLYDPKKDDLTVGGYFLKGINSPVIKKSDSGTIKYIKGRIWDEVRKNDPAPPAIRTELKKITAFKNKYFNTLGRYPKRSIIKEKFNISDQKLDELLAFESIQYTKIALLNAKLS